MIQLVSRPLSPTPTRGGDAQLRCLSVPLAAGPPLVARSRGPRALTVLAVLLPALAIPAVAAATDPGSGAKPNIVLIVADDLGHGDLSSYGGDIPTPRIDSIARDGVRLPVGYVSAPVCNPSRAGFLTGRYQQRWGQEMNFQTEPPDGAPRSSLPQAETTLGTAMKALGYATGAIGKWHMGMRPGYHPMDRGFDEFFGMASGTRYVDRSWPGIHVLDDTQAFERSEPKEEREDISAEERAAYEARRGLYRGREPAALEEYVTDQLAREGVAFIEHHKSEPFFLYVAFNAPHVPLETTDVYYQRFPQFKDERKRIHAAMISALDDGVGRVLDKLAEIGATENTIVVFISDNGGPETSDADGRCNAPFIGHKRYLYEGGIREPYMIRWPARLAAGGVYAEMVSTLDLLPTLTTAAGAPASAPGRQLDGTNLLPFLTGERKGAAHDALYWRTGQNGAMRQGSWKLLLLGDRLRLYDLANDIEESHDLSVAKPEVVERMRAAWKAWNAELATPRKSGRSVLTTYNGDEIRWDI